MHVTLTFPGSSVFGVAPRGAVSAAVTGGTITGINRTPRTAHAGFTDARGTVQQRGGPCHGNNQTTGRIMTLTATDTAMPGSSGSARGDLTAQGREDGWRRTSPTIPAQRVRPRAGVRSVLIYDQRPDGRAVLTRRVTAAVPSVDDITCVTTPAEMIHVFDARPTDLVFIGMDHPAGRGEDTVALFLRRHPTATVIVVGTITDIQTLTTSLARGAVGLMLWDPWYDPSRLPAPRQSVRDGTQVRPVTRAERGILESLSRGLSNREIGIHLNLSEDTVKSKTRALYRKLGARDRAHAVALALRRQLIS